MLIAFANSLDPDLDPKCFDTLVLFLKEFFEKVDFEKKNQQTTKSMKNYQVGIELIIFLIEMPFNAFANRADPDQAALVRAA